MLDKEQAEAIECQLQEKLNRKSLEGMNREERREIAQGTLDKYLRLEEEERCAMIMHLNMCGIEKSTFT